MRRIPRSLPHRFLGFLLLAACGVPQGCASSASTSAPPESDLACDEPVWNLGSAQVFPPNLEHTFLVRNRSTADAITISEVRTACGCSVVDKSFNRELSAGEVSRITVRFKAPDAPGPFQHDIAVIAKTPGVLPLVLQVSGKVLDNPSLASFLPKIDFGSLAGSETKRREVDIYRHNLDEVSGVKLVSPSGAVTLASALVARGDGVYRIVLELDGAQIADGEFFELIEIRPNIGRGVEIPVRGTKSNLRELFIPSVALGLTVGETKNVRLLLVDREIDVSRSEYKGDARLRVTICGSDAVIECTDPSARGELLQGDVAFEFVNPPAQIQIPVQVLCR